MKRYFSINNAYLLSIVLLCSTAIYANDTMDENECPIVMPDFDDMVLLTREERIQLMDQALKDALSQVQDCRQQLSERQNQNSGGAGGAGGSDNSNGENTNANQSEENASNGETQNQQTATPSNNETQNQQPATPSSELSGTETSEQTDTQPAQTPMPSNELSGSEPEKPDPKSATGKLPDEQQAPEQTATQPAAKDNERTLDNGKLPEDIPPADNDDIIAKQIREAAISEPDPAKQAKLWNEYRRYKGISEK